MVERKMYGDLAWAWPIISPPEDYVDESHALAKTIEGRARGEVRTLLHLGCGGGHNDRTLKEYFDVTGVDISKEMLELARNLNPEASYQEGDIRSVRLGRTFDAVIVLDTVDYMLSEDDLRAAFETAHAHLEGGGIFVTYRELSHERFTKSWTNVTTHARGDLRITLLEEYYDPDPGDTVVDATFVILVRKGSEVEVHTDRHQCGLFPMEVWTHLLEEVGFEVERFELETREGEGPITVFSCIKA